MDENRTIYSIIDQQGQASTITLEKFVADTLQDSVSDVHAWVQLTYNKVAEKRPHLGRRQQGDLVRALSWREAINHLSSSGQLDDM